MATNRIQLVTVDEFMQGYSPIYQPIYPLFLGSKSQQYPAEVGKIDNRRMQAIGEVRARHITPKDTEIRQIAVTDGKKTFKKYFFANQFIQSQVQDQQGANDVVAQVLDEHQAQQDELLLLGEGTTSTNTVNNGLYWSGDPNYTLESNAGISSVSTLVLLHQAMVGTAIKADQLAGQKTMIIYGSTLLPYFRSLYDNAARAFRAVLQEALPGYSFVELPTSVTPSGANGWILANLDQVKTHYTVLPALLDQGFNAEKMYYWHNFMLGSMMLEVLAQNGVIRQPMTIV